MNDRYIAAIEISSSKIVAAIGKTQGNGKLEIIAVEHEKTVEGGVRYGIIQNLEETSMSVARLFSRLEQRQAISPRKIKGVIVGLSGRSLKNITKEVSLNLPEDTEINEEIMQRLKEAAETSAIDNTLEVIDAVPRIYKVGTSETASPKGMIGNHISAIYDLIVCRPELKRNIKRTIEDKLRLNVQGFVVTAMATAHLMLTPEEKRLGCMLVDMGSETTTVTIYQKGYLTYFATLPMGGRNITRDLASLGIVDSKAEEIKLTAGNAIADSSNSSLNINGLKFTDISNLVVARSEEIVANIIEQLEYAGLKETDIPGGIICIGGGFKLKGMRELLQIHSDLPVKLGKLPEYVKIEDSRANNVETMEVASVLYAGATLTDKESLETPERPPLPVNGVLPLEDVDDTIENTGPEEPDKPRNGIFEKLGKRIGNWFGGSIDDDTELR